MGPRWAQVALVLVSHSRALAEGAAEVAGQMAPGVLIVPAGGLDDGGVGTSYARVERAVAEASADGRSVVVLTDLGSAVMTTESVLDLADADVAGRVRLADAPFVEGAVAAGVTAHGGGDLDAVLASAHDAGGTFAGWAPGQGDARPEGAAGGVPPAVPDGAVRATAVLRNRLGLHARPAAVLARALAAYDARVRVNGANGASVLELMKLGAQQGDSLEVVAEGPQAAEAVHRLVTAVEDGFGEE
ncbi:dihydroxyacetone kinase phosphoryl donor subunit DhaM [Cellulomonas shaoxiangyii]|uniref:Phosphocarrier protein HPr n=2 Tax=Cellulomonas shaoxiangyii TaxID=2566013 RepID=A0A4V1CMS8_9CELL|nr:dihydroxyacetone kinase phosphoryl donor subunit DhaM [Cellulomonas shaoxiangyii]QCB93995.1 HPr family phosphocarrier protein [Cellulomonas shaoxiangyii]TGY83030.1 HPr family phosphocarrier protein [Cellulomonas shaoxiangyii]